MSTETDDYEAGYAEGFHHGRSTPLRVDWRVLGGVIPGPIPVEWVRVGDTIRDHGFEGSVTAVRAAGGLVVIESGHVSFAKVAHQDWVHVVVAAKGLVDVRTR